MAISAMQICVGVDGGGTRASALATRIDGTALARRVGPAALVHSTDPSARLPQLQSLVRKVITESGGTPPVAALCCALAGAGRESVRRGFEDALARSRVAERVRVVTDAEAALHDAFNHGPGVLLIAGTGSIAWARAPDGRHMRSGGWGAMIGDEGSGWAIGLAGLRAVARAIDGRGPATSLTQSIIAEVRVADPADLITWADGAGKAGIAALAPVVIAAAVHDPPDEVAAAIVERAAHDLANHVGALVSTLAPWPATPRVALAGGLIAHGRPLRHAVERALIALDPPCEIAQVAVDGARGAAALARELVHEGE
jgi:N-acetylglucosamine kinase-like BadF-type ATPase